MSQAGQNSGNVGPTPPVIATQYTTDVNGPAIPSANNLNVLGLTLEDNFQNGIITDGLSDTLYIGLTNRIVGSTSTVGAVTSPIITFSSFVGGIGTYTIECRVSAYNSTSSLGAGYSLFGAVRFDGVNANICDTFDEIINEEGTMTNLDIFVSVSGGSLLINGTGYADQTINWSAVALYTFVGA
jgi:hypothetical protein